MRIFDVHTHVFPDAIAARALEVMQKKSRDLPVFNDGTLDGLSRLAKNAGYTGWLNAPVVTSAKQMKTVNDWVAERNVWPHLSLGGIYPHAAIEEIVAEVQRIRQLGLLGLKFHPEYQEFAPLDETYAPLWQACSDLQLPVLFHAGQDIAYPDVRHSSPRDFRILAERFPKLQIICAHLGGWMDWDQVLTDLLGAPVYLDTAFASLWMEDKSVFARIIRQHGTGRILFGTDSPWRKLEDGIDEIKNADFLSEAEKEDIFWNNADRLFHLSERMPTTNC